MQRFIFFRRTWGAVEAGWIQLVGGQGVLRPSGVVAAASQSAARCGVAERGGEWDQKLVAARG